MRTSFIIFYSTLLLFSCNRGSNLNAVEKKIIEEITYSSSKSNTKGYTALAFYEDKFIASGSDGRIDQISSSGKIIKTRKFQGVKINCLASYNKTIIAGGDSGVLLFASEDGIFRSIKSGTDKKINSISYFQDMIITGNDGGEILSGNIKDGFRIIHPGIKGNILSVSARPSECFGVTDKGEIISTTDGINWKIFDFNKEYSGFYKLCYFNKVLAIENRIAIIGVKDDGSPVLMFSNQGNVWTERTLNYTGEDGSSDVLKDLPNDIYYDYSGDQFFLVCNNGKLMKIPSCSHCNTLTVLAVEDITAIAGDNDTIIIAGENFFCKAINPTWF